MHAPNPHRYQSMPYRRSGHSGLLLPVFSLGLWHNFGDVDSYDEATRLICQAFDQGITHFDLANNYGPPPGSAESNFGKILEQQLKSHRDEMIISTKAGWKMWEGPYGDWGSRKYLIASLDQSLKRMGLDYVDIFYSHRPDPHTPIEETMGALDQIVRSGKALYVGISSYSPEQTKKASQILRELGTPCLIHQPRYSMLYREPENGLLDTLEDEGIGCIGFSALAQGVLTGKYNQGIPKDSRADRPEGYLKAELIQQSDLDKVRKLGEIAAQRGQSLGQMALAWTLRDPRMTSTIIGARTTQQLTENLASLAHIDFSAEELQMIDVILNTQHS